MSSSRSFGPGPGTSVKYRWLVLRIQEYPLNKELLKLAEKDIGPSAHMLRETPVQRGRGSSTESKAIMIADLKRRIYEVEKALEVVPEEYRAGVLYHTLNHGTKTMGVGKGSAWADKMFQNAHRNTWTKWKTRFLLEYADIIGEGSHMRLLMRYGEDLEDRKNN